MNTHTTLLFLMLISLFSSCKQNTALTQKLDFADTTNWAALPSAIEKEVDVFFVYPTLFGGTENMNMDIADQDMRTLVQAVLLKQAAVFEQDCNLYAPYYRQMALDGLSKEAEERNKYFSIGYADVLQAFDYYIKYMNKGRPFIIAGHSQGSEALIQLMIERFDDPKLMNKLVAAYLIGYSVTDEDLTTYKWLKMATSSDDVGSIISYNTQSESATGSPILLPNAKCINPLNWETSSKYAAKELNLGAVFFKDNGEVDSIANQFTDAWIDKQGALVAGIPDVATYSSSSFPKGVYHVFDYSFFFKNLKKNVQVRTQSYLNKNE